MKKPPFIAEKIMNHLVDKEEKEFIIGDLNEFYVEKLNSCGPLKADLWYWGQIIKSFHLFKSDRFIWRLTMFSNYFKITLRNIFKNTLYSMINIMGLAIGIACCIFIFLFVSEETGFDRYHNDFHRIYRVAVDIKEKTSNSVFAPTALPVGPALKENFSQVEHVARIWKIGSGLVQYRDKSFYEEKQFLADNEIFDIFTIPFLEGRRESALRNPGSLVITNRKAIKYFGKQNPLGKVLRVNKREWEITGVVFDTPDNTHFKFDFLFSLNTYAKNNVMKSWHHTMAYTYIKLKPNVDVSQFAQGIKFIANKYVGKTLKSWGSEYHFFLQPLYDIHLYSHLRYEIEPPGNAQMVIIFAAVGLLILLIACINFMNLTTARSANRAREVGLRKTLGGQKKQLMVQFLSESMLTAFCSLLFAIGFVIFFLPFFNSQMGTHFLIPRLFQPHVMAMLILLTLVTGILAGIYPAFFLSSFKPVSTLKASFTPGSSKLILRKILVVLQFSITIILIVCTIVVFQQLKFMEKQNLGFNKEQKLVIPFRGGMDISKKHEFIKDEFIKNSDIQDATFSSDVPGREVHNFAIKLVGEENDRSQSMYHLYYDPDFIPNYGMKVIAGRAFDKKLSSDKRKAFLINRAALTAFGWNEPEQAIGKILQTGWGGRQNRIIGVVENFHFRSLQYKVEPLVMEWLPDAFQNMTLTVNTKNLRKTISFIKNKWDSLFPGYPVEYYFLDEDFNRQYLSEKRTGSLFGVFTFLSQFIACLGLLGLATFSAQQRTKEIGIRKVLGASSASIFYLLSKEFVKWVILANIIAWPISYWVTKRWLLNFAYRTDVQLIFFILSALIVLIISLFTISFQCLKTAHANPVSALRWE